jgi:uncharacterized protein YijF (DUF1287 family)
MPASTLFAALAFPAGSIAASHNIGSRAKMEDVLFAYSITGHYRYPATAN